MCYYLMSWLCVLIIWSLNSGLSVSLRKLWAPQSLRCFKWKVTKTCTADTPFAITMPALSIGGLFLFRILRIRQIFLHILLKFRLRFLR